MTSQTQPTVALNDGAAMPQFGLGVFQTPPDATEQVVKLAVEQGYRSVDTASVYRNEDGVGAALLGRTDVFVTTKLGNSDYHGFDQTLRAFDDSMRRLRRDTLDLYLIHWPNPRANRYVESWKAFVRLQKDGRVRSIGVSNFNRDHVERIIGETGVTPTVNQIELDRSGSASTCSTPPCTAQPMCLRGWGSRGGAAVAAATTAGGTAAAEAEPTATGTAAAKWASRPADQT